jgi:alanyl-tRNA synthetase
VSQLLEQQKKLEREITALRSKLAASAGGTDLAAQAVEVNGVSVLAARIEGADAGTLREAADRYKGRLGEAVVVLGAQVADDKVSLVSSVSPATSKKVSAGALIGEVAKLVGGRGGGRPDFAQAGGNDPSKLDDALRAVPRLVADKLGGT